MWIYENHIYEMRAKVSQGNLAEFLMGFLDARLLFKTDGKKTGWAGLAAISSIVFIVKRSVGRQYLLTSNYSL